MNKMETLQYEYDTVLDRQLIYPEYYMKPFHAYDDGNLSWQCAVEVESAALTVHAPIYTESNKVLRKDGDWNLRNFFHAKMKVAFAGSYECV